MNYFELPYEDHLKALENAKAAGDSAAVDHIRSIMESYPQYHYDAYNKAMNAGDVSAATTIAHQYDNAFRAEYGDITADNLNKNQVFMHNATALWRADHPDKAVPDQKEIADYGLGLARDKAYMASRGFYDLARAADGSMTPEEAAASLGLQAVHEDMAASPGGLWGALFRQIDPAIVLGGKLGSSAASAVADKLAAGTISKVASKLAAKGLDHELAGKVAADAVKAGASTVPRQALGRAIEGAGIGAPMGAAGSAEGQAGMIGAGQQQGVDVGDLIGGAAVGAGIGAGAGAIAHVPRVGKAAQVGRDSTKFAADYSKVGNPLAMNRLRAAAMDVTGEDVGPAMAKKLTNETMMRKVLDRALKEPINNLRLMSRRLLDMKNSGEIPERTYMEAMDALSSAKSKGRSPAEFAPDMVRTHPERYAELSKLVKAINDESAVVDDITRQAGDLFEQPGLAESVLNDPAVAIVADRLPSGYVTTRAGGKLLRMLRKGKIGQELVDRLNATEALDQQASKAGPAAMDAVDKRLSEAHNSEGVGRAVADQADAFRQDRLRAKAEAKAVRNAAKGKGMDPQQAARARAAAIRAGRQVEGTRHGGVQGELGVRLGLDRPQGVRILKQMADEAKVNGDPQRAAAIQRFRQDYEAGLDTRRPWRDTKDEANALYYSIQEELLKRSRPMSPEAYRPWLKNTAQMNSGEKLGRMAKARLKGMQKLKKARAATDEGAPATPDSPSSGNTPPAVAAPTGVPEPSLAVPVGPVQLAAARAARARPTPALPQAQLQLPAVRPLEGEVMPRPERLGQPGRSPMTIDMPRTPMASMEANASFGQPGENLTTPAGRLRALVDTAGTPGNPPVLPSFQVQKLLGEVAKVRKSLEDSKATSKSAPKYAPKLERMSLSEMKARYRELQRKGLETIEDAKEFVRLKALIAEKEQKK